MREHKFRAWDGVEMKYADGYRYALLFNGVVGHYRHQTDGYYTVGWHLMQFVGIKDANDRDVYEGDIVLWPHLGPEAQHHVVHFDSKELHYTATPCSAHHEDTAESWLDSTHMVVVGNIFENPDLYTCPVDGLKP